MDVGLGGLDLRRKPCLLVDKLEKVCCSTSNIDIFRLIEAASFWNPFKGRKPFDFETLPKRLVGICIDLGNDDVGAALKRIPELLVLWCKTLALR